ncbi:MAG: hypothetical protein AAB214_17680 [Fibrobacterota bacterium]
MRQIPTAIVLAAATTFSVTPHSFTAGRSVIAQEMNENFAAVDSALQNRATKADLQTKADASALPGIQTTIGSLQTKKAEKSYVDALRDALKNKAETSAVTKAISDTANTVRALIPVIDISTKADTVKTNPVSRKVDALAVSKQDNLGYAPYKPGQPLDSLRVGGIFQSLRVGLPTQGALYAGDITPNQTNYGLTLTRDGATSVLNASSTSALAINDNVVLAASPRLATISDTLAVKVAGRFGATPPAYNVDPLQVSGSVTLQNMTGVPDSLTLQFKGGSAYGAGSMSILAATDGTKTQTINIMNSSGNALFSISNNDGNAKFSGTITTGVGTQIPDYVFEPSYKLASLSDVEAYTAQHKHLPEVPSAAEIEKGGLDLAQMNLILLKKVEELTLHAIAQQKELHAQKAAFEKLLQRLDAPGN